MEYKKKILLWKLKYKEKRCCILCGYKEHTEILHFHHKKQKKRINRNSKGWKNYWKSYKRVGSKPKRNKPIATLHNLNEIKKEAKKCVLLCPNCHALFHRKTSIKTIRIS